jgi:predicted small lipoprotein YifL
MKRFAWILVVALGASLAITGCGHKGAVSTSELRSSFKSAEPAMQSQVDKAVASVKSNNYPEALSDLQVLSHKARLTPDQQQSLKDTIAAIQNKISSTTNKPADGPQKLPAELQKLLGKPK